MKKISILILFIIINMPLFSQSGLMQPNNQTNSSAIFGNVTGPNGAISNAAIIVTNPEVSQFYGETYSTIKMVKVLVISAYQIYLQMFS